MPLKQKILLKEIVGKQDNIIKYSDLFSIACYSTSTHPTPHPRTPFSHLELDCSPQSRKLTGGVRAS